MSAADLPTRNRLDDNSSAPSLWGWPTFASIGVTLSILGVLASMLNPEEILRELKRTNIGLLALGAFSHYATYPLRGGRWRRALAHLPLTAGSGKFALIVFFYNAVDNIVPAKLGDLYAAHLVRINCGIRRSAALGSLVFLRTIDAWTVLGLGAAASWLLFAASMEWAVVWSLIAGAVIALGTTSVILALFLLKRRVPRWLPEPVQEMVMAFNVGMWPRTREIVPIVLLTFCVWGLEVLWMVLLLSAFDIRVSPAIALFVTMLPMLASAFPITPSGAGVVEVTLYACLRLVSVSSPVAASLTVVNRLIDYWFHIILGLFTWSVRRFVGLRTWREPPTAMSFHHQKS